MPQLVRKPWAAPTTLTEPTLETTPPKSSLQQTSSVQTLVQEHDLKAVDSKLADDGQSQVDVPPVLSQSSAPAWRFGQRADPYLPINMNEHQALNDARRAVHQGTTPVATRTGDAQSSHDTASVRSTTSTTVVEPTSTPRNNWAFGQRWDPNRPPEHQR